MLPPLGAVLFARLPQHPMCVSLLELTRTCDVAFNGQLPHQRLLAYANLSAASSAAGIALGLRLTADMRDPVALPMCILVARQFGASPYVQQTLEANGWLQSRWIHVALRMQDSALPLGYNNIAQYQYPNVAAALDESVPSSRRLLSLQNLVYSGAIVSTCVCSLLRHSPNEVVRGEACDILRERFA